MTSSIWLFRRDNPSHKPTKRMKVASSSSNSGFATQQQPCWLLNAHSQSHPPQGRAPVQLTESIILGECQKKEEEEKKVTTVSRSEAKTCKTCVYMNLKNIMIKLFTSSFKQEVNGSGSLCTRAETENHQNTWTS